MISKKAILGHLRHVFSRRKIEKFDKDSAIKYINTYVAQKDHDKQLNTVLEQIKEIMLRDYICFGIKSTMIETLRKIEYKGL